MTRTMKKIGKCLSTFLTVILCAFVLAFLAGWLFGMQAFVVLSGSMEPTYPVGSLIVVRPIRSGQLHVGDPITFTLQGDMVVTHRISEIVIDEENGGGLRFRTKGDANETEDAGLVEPHNLIGVPVLCIPRLGYVMSYIKSPPGIFAIGLLCLLILVLNLLTDQPAKKPQKRGRHSPRPEEKTKER